MFTPERTSRAVRAPGAATPSAPARPAASAPPGLPLFLQARPAGRALDADTRAAMEARLGADFAGVRVHTDAGAAASAREAAARAYTVGQDVVFAAGQYAPSTADGARLLAHELAHVVQQGRGGPPPAPNGPTERAAEHAAAAAVDGTGPTVVAGASGVGLARSAWPGPAAAPPQAPGTVTDQEIMAARAWLAAHTENDPGYDQVQRHLAYLLQLREQRAPAAAADAARPAPIVNDEARLNPWPPRAPAPHAPAPPVRDAEAERREAFARELRENPTAQLVLDPETRATLGYRITSTGVERLFDAEGRFVRTLGEVGLETPPADPSDVALLLLSGGASAASKVLGGGLKAAGAKAVGAKAAGGAIKAAGAKAAGGVAESTAAKVGAREAAAAAGPLVGGVRAASEAVVITAFKKSRSPVAAYTTLEREFPAVLQRIDGVTSMRDAVFVYEKLEEVLLQARAFHGAHLGQPYNDKLLALAEALVERAGERLAAVSSKLPPQAVPTSATAFRALVTRYYPGFWP